MKYSVHRRLHVRSFMPEDDGYNKCRCCHAAKETQAHLHRCYALWPIWREYRRLVGTMWKVVRPCVELTYLGMNDEGVFLPLGLRAMHAILWKMIIIEFTLAGIEEGKIFETKKIFPFVMSRMQTRLNAVIYNHKNRIADASRRSRKPPNDDKVNETLYPFACMEGSKVIWNDGWVNKCKDHEIEM